MPNLVKIGDRTLNMDYLIIAIEDFDEVSCRFIGMDQPVTFEGEEIAPLLSILESMSTRLTA